jgi:hypothetical protein
VVMTEKESLRLDECRSSFVQRLTLLHLARTISGFALLVRYFMLLLTSPLAVRLFLLWIICHTRRNSHQTLRDETGLFT